MGNINIIIPDELEQHVRERIVKDHGKRGALTNAVKTGLELWLKHRQFVEMYPEPAPQPESPPAQPKEN